MPIGLAALLPAIIGGAAAAGTSVIKANQAKKQHEADATRFVLDPVLKDRQQEDDFGSSMAVNQPNLTLRPGGRPIIFNK